MKNKCNSKLLISLLSGPVALGSVSCNYGEAKPNFILFIADDVSWNDLGCYGNRDVKTPNIDRLASNGMQFNNFFLTASSSSPSRNSIITGRYPHNTGGEELHSEPPEFMISFPELLRTKGYYTCQAGKFHMGKYARRGFDQINDGKENGDGGEEQWLRCLKEGHSGKPFFFWFAAHDAHRIWGPNTFTSTHNPDSVLPPDYLVNGPKTRRDLAAYYDEIARFDHYIGLICDELEKQKLIENTVIIVMADNGRPFPHSKTRVNDRGLKSPFVVHWPDGIAGKNMVCNSLLSAIDLAPTILDLASVPVPETVQGLSFKSLFSNPESPFRRFVFGEHNWHDYEAHERMVRTDRYLYILNSRPQYPQCGPADAVGSDTFYELDSIFRRSLTTEIQTDVFIAPRASEELYDASVDPGQFINIAGDHQNMNILDSLRKVLKEWMKETGDNIPDSITRDWYEKVPGYVKTGYFNIRGEQVSKRYNATTNNNKGRF
jgi:arylsulfatase A-like enzyme